jgi:transcriptional regulator with XRE-family HTH domain
MTPQERRQELGKLLRGRRECLRPDDLGLRSGARRRARGLRREEVAARAGVSVSWYTWLEQGRKIRPSAGVLGRICRTLRLSGEEREYVSLLTDQDVRERRRWCGDEWTAHLISMQSTLDAFAATPAALYNTRFDVVAANAPARAVYGGDMASGSRWERNMIWRFFMDEERRRLYPDATADRGIRNLIEALRLGWASEDGDSVAELIDEMRTLSRDFDAIWSERKVARLGIIPGRVRPRQSSRPLRVEYSRFYVPTLPGYAIAALIPVSSEDAAMLRSHVDRIA